CGRELGAITAPLGFDSVCFSPDGTRLAGCQSSVVHVWDVATGAELHALRGQSVAVRQAAFTPDGARLMTLDAAGTVKTWELTARPKPGPIPTLSSPGSPTDEFRLTADGRRSLVIKHKVNRPAPAPANPAARTTATITLELTAYDESGRKLAQFNGPAAGGGRAGSGRGGFGV